MALTLLPTLDIGCPLLRDIRDIVAYTLRHAVYSPGRTSYFFDDYDISLRLLHAEYGRYPDKLAGIFQIRMQGVIDRYAPGDGYTVEVTSRNDDTVEDGTAYILSIKVKNAYGEYVVTTDQLIVGETKQTLQIEYKNAEGAYEQSTNSTLTKTS